MAAEFEVVGLDELIAQLEEIGKGVSRIENTALKAAAEPIAVDMRNQAPVSNIDHQHIKDDIQISGVKTKEGVKYVMVGPGETAWRAKFIEWGTSKMPAHPFIQPAGEKNANTTPEIIANVLRGYLKL
jgi:HK97 gp10 family phage protein